MNPLKSLLGGLAGAAVLNAVHESARQVIPHAPRVDVIGRRALAKSYRLAGATPPEDPALYFRSMVMDVTSNAAYYALAGLGDRDGAVRRGAILGAIGGIGAVTLPQRLHLGRQPGRKSPWTQLMTIAWYTLGGLAAGATLRAMTDERE